MMKNLLISLTLLAALVVDSNAQTTIYDTFVTNGNPVGWSQDPTNKFYDPVNEDSQISQGNQWTGTAFSVLNYSKLNDFTLGLKYDNGVATYNVALTSDVAGVPGTVMDSWTVTENSPGANSGDYTVNFKPNQVDVLNVGTYFITVKAQNPGGLGGWNFNNSGFTGTFAVGQTGVGWVLVNQNNFLTTPVMAVRTSPVPEPCTMAVLGLGIVGLLFRVKK